MKISDDQLIFDGPKVFEIEKFSDSRGFFLEWFQEKEIEKAGLRRFDVAQANFSSSNKGVIRGIHFAKIPPGQGKFVTCLSGKVFDVLVDLRKNSSTFGRWESVILDSELPKAVFIPKGFGHAFMALKDSTTFVYLCDQTYNPNNEFEINPFDETLNIEWPKNIEVELSTKDLQAKSFLDSFDRF